MRDWDDAYDNMGHVPGSTDLPDRWAARAAAYRRATPGLTLGIAYGDKPRQAFDLVQPAGPVKGLVVFVHGGYWRRFDRSLWTDLAEGARAHGWTVALPSYTLAPESRIAEITREVGTAITAAAGMVDGPIRLAGHSAGGHLVTRMMVEDGPLPADVAARIALALTISGVHDLRPLLRIRMNETLRLDADEAGAESPALLVPRAGGRIACRVGGAERPEFIRQSELLALIWSGFDVETSLVIEPDANHFTIVDGLASPDSPITRQLLDLS